MVFIASRCVAYVALAGAFRRAMRRQRRVARAILDMTCRPRIAPAALRRIDVTKRLRPSGRCGARVNIGAVRATPAAADAATSTSCFAHGLYLTPPLAYYMPCRANIAVMGFASS